MSRVFLMSIGESFGWKYSCPSWTLMLNDSVSESWRLKISINGVSIFLNGYIFVPSSSSLYDQEST